MTVGRLTAPDWEEPTVPTDKPAAAADSKLHGQALLWTWYALIAAIWYANTVIFFGAGSGISVFTMAACTIIVIAAGIKTRASLRRR